MTTSTVRVFTDALAEAEEIIAGAPHVTTERDLAEGLDYLSGLARTALQMGWARDRDYPRFARVSTPWTKMGLDNPDTLYYATTIRGDAEYVVTGSRGTTADLVFQVLDGGHASSTAPASQLAFDDRDFEIAEDGTFQLRLGPATGHPGPNYVTLARDATRLLARQTYSDWAKETPGTLSIQRADRTGRPPEPPTSDIMHDRYQAAARTLLGYLKTFLEFGTLHYMDEPINTLYPPKITPGGLTNQYSSAGHFDLADDEALIVTVPDSGMPYQGIQLGTPWYVSMDFINHQTSLTARQASIDPDGHIRFVVSHRDPGLANWLETTGHHTGYLQIRWQRASRALTERDGPVTELVRFADLPNRLPYYERNRVTAHEWAERIAARQAAVGARMLG
ncbi:MAG: hypothetical protein GEV04_13135 [Actinophytocola sp.]|nr:hypothetical protein [Actinophytocola sp.]